MQMLRRILAHPLVDFVVSLLLIGASLAEGWETLLRDLQEFKAGVHHGVLLFGLVTFLRTLPEVWETAEHLWKGKDEEGGGEGSGTGAPAAAGEPASADQEGQG
ncbi:MAG: hypothetical protein MI919_04005 [Holophagales bacterium]|nr:hypothetical protein [Holophagales bacterium]